MLLSVRLSVRQSIKLFLNLQDSFKFSQFLHKIFLKTSKIFSHIFLNITTKKNKTLSYPQQNYQKNQHTWKKQSEKIWKSCLTSYIAPMRNLFTHIHFMFSAFFTMCTSWIYLNHVWSFTYSVKKYFMYLVHADMSWADM